jgi:hypothetical protein
VRRSVVTSYCDEHLIRRRLHIRLADTARRHNPGSWDTRLSQTCCATASLTEAPPTWTAGPTSLMP